MAKQELHGFVLKRKERIVEQKMTGYEYEHKKSGAKLVWLSNNDNECFYGVGFKTPVNNDKGIPHVLEHSVLMGSEDFPTRDPFLMLLRRAHISFLNAMTFPDKTFYPVGSTHSEDLKKMAHVYTDAVFRPNILKNENIFRQEGVRLESNGKELVANGVVFNEMKGVFSSPKNILHRAGYPTLLKDTPYRFETGGTPEEIVKLKHSDITSFHESLYNPSNAYFFLYGELDIEWYLAFLNEKYLKDYKRIKVNNEIPFQKKWNKEKTKTVTYNSNSSKEYLSYLFLGPKSWEVDDLMSLQILDEYLMGSESSPLKQELIKSGLASDFESTVEDQIQETFFAIDAVEAKEKSANKIKKIVESTLTAIVQNGVDAKRLRAAINTVELQILGRSEQSEKGLEAAFEVFNTWLYGKNPFISLHHKKLIKKQKDLLKKPGHFEDVINKYLLQNNNKIFVRVKPENRDRIQEKVDGFLTKKTQKMKKEDFDALREKNKTFREWQDAEDIDESKLFPLAKRSEFSVKPSSLRSKTSQKNGLSTHTYVSPVASRNHVYQYINVSDFSEEDLAKLTLLSKMLTRLGTGKKTAADLYTERSSFSDLLQFRVDILELEKQNFAVYFGFNSSYLPRRYEKVIDHTRNIFKNAVLNKEVLQNVIDSEIAETYTQFLGANPRIAVDIAAAQSNNFDKAKDSTRGLAYYQFLKSLRDTSVLLDEINDLREEIIKRSVSLTLNIVQENQKLNEQVFSTGDVLVEKLLKIKANKNMQSLGVASDSIVQFNGVGFQNNMRNNQEEALAIVFSDYLNRDHIWKTIREKGGAYGGAIQISPRTVSAVSWRDPRLGETIRDLRAIPDYLDLQNPDKDTLDRLVVRGFSTLDKPQSLQALVVKDFARKVKGTSSQDEKEIRKTIKELDEKTFKKFASKLAKTMRGEGVNISIGNRKKVLENKKYFDQIIDL